jgi:DNA invertase Pin-like site-specific DNA recombinase
MTDSSKIKNTHTQRTAVVYIRQSTSSQVEYNRESTARQYALSERACQLGWPKEQVVVIDEISASPALASTNAPALLA